MGPSDDTSSHMENYKPLETNCRQIFAFKIEDGARRVILYCQWRVGQGSPVPCSRVASSYSILLVSYGDLLKYQKVSRDQSPEPFADRGSQISCCRLLLPVREDLVSSSNF